MDSSVGICSKCKSLYRIQPEKLPMKCTKCGAGSIFNLNVAPVDWALLSNDEKISFITKRVQEAKAAKQGATTANLEKGSHAPSDNKGETGKEEKIESLGDKLIKLAEKFKKDFQKNKKKFKIKKQYIIAAVAVVVVLILIGLFVSAGKKKPSKYMTGAWYSEGDDMPSFILHDDGTCIINGEYGTGTWSIDKNNNFTLTNFYGDSEHAKVKAVDKNHLELTIGDVVSVFWHSPKEKTPNKSKKEDISQSFDEDKIIYEDNESFVEENQNSIEELEETLEPISIASGMRFSEGLAIVSYYFGDDERNTITGLLRNTGELISLDLPFEDTYRSWSEFRDGYAYINRDVNDEREFVIIDENGNCVLQNDSDAGYNIICGGDGLFLVKKTIRTMDVSEDQYGIIRADGTWIYEPRADFMLAPNTGEQWWLEKWVEFSYLDDGFFLAEWHIWNTPVCVVLEAKEGVYNPVELPEESSVIGEHDKNIIWTYRDYNKDSIFRLDEAGTQVEIASFEGRIRAKLSEGIICVSGDNRTLFCDIYGNVLRDFGEYSMNFKESIGEVKNGYAAVLLNGADGYEYLQIVDINGNCNFEAKKLNESYFYDNGKMACILNDNPGEISWVDKDGNIEITTTKSVKFYDLRFAEGYAFDVEDDCYVSYLGDELPIMLR